MHWLTSSVWAVIPQAGGKARVQKSAQEKLEITLMKINVFNQLVLVLTQYENVKQVWAPNLFMNTSLQILYMTD